MTILKLNCNQTLMFEEDIQRLVYSKLSHPEIKTCHNFIRKIFNMENFPGY